MEKEFLNTRRGFRGLVKYFVIEIKIYIFVLARDSLAMVRKFQFFKVQFIFVLFQVFDYFGLHIVFDNRKIYFRLYYYKQVESE